MAVMRAAYKAYLKDTYCPVLTEAKGLKNIFISGILQFLGGQILKYSSKPYHYNTLSQRHISRGIASFNLGNKQFLPGAVAIGGFYVMYLIWKRYTE